jgi:3-carboxy-cis,cis-muconate cycloisomerase
MAWPASGPLLGPLFTDARYAGHFSDRAAIAGMLAFEAALARAEVTAGVIPAGAAGPIAAVCAAPERFDVEALGEAAQGAGNPVIPLIAELTARVAESDPEAAGFVHWGATSQDVMDTGLALQLRGFIADLEGDLATLSTRLAVLARDHASTVMIGRTWLQQAVPTTLGLKVAGWLDAITRHRERLGEVKPRLLALQFGGAAGTRAALMGQGAAVEAALARELGLRVASLPWHAQRDRLVELGSFLGLLTGTLGKIARDVSLMAQTEIGELAEASGEGRGGSSTMPHKRNPVGCAVVLAAATRAPGLVATLLSAMPQEHERGLGGWPAEWETLPELCRLAGGALARTNGIMAGLEVDPGRMRANLGVTGGLVMAEALMMRLAPKLGRSRAKKLVERASRESVRSGRPLAEVASADSDIVAQLGRNLELMPEAYLGDAAALVERVLAAFREQDIDGEGEPG